MKAFFTAVIAAVVIAAGAMYALDTTWQRRADQAFVSGTSVRIPDHGTTHNLVGKDWYSAKEH
jgi:hypothetical protein